MTQRLRGIARLVAAGGLLLAAGHLALDYDAVAADAADPDDVPATGLGDLTRNPYDVEDNYVRTPLEELRKRMSKPRDRISRKPEIAGAMLFMRAANQFNPKARGPLIDDTVRWFRNNREAGNRVWALVEIYRNRNPQLGQNIDLVKAQVQHRIDRRSARELDWLQN